MSIKDLPEDFFERFRTVLRSLPSLQVAAEMTGYSYEQIAKWRDNKARPPFQPLMILTQAAGRSLDWLATGVEPSAEMVEMMSQTVLQQSLVHSDVTMIPRLNVRLSAGLGRANSLPEEVERVPISRALLRRLDIQPQNAHIVQADGDSMEDEIFDKDDVLIDTGVDRPIAEGIYAVVDGDLGMIKRLQPIASMGLMRVISDNPRYEAQTVKMDEPNFEIVGRAKLVMRIL